jgi:hypothetical protein
MAYYAPDGAGAMEGRTAKKRMAVFLDAYLMHISHSLPAFPLTRLKGRDLAELLTSR